MDERASDRDNPDGSEGARPTAMVGRASVPGLVISRPEEAPASYRATATPLIPMPRADEPAQPAPPAPAAPPASVPAPRSDIESPVADPRSEPLPRRIAQKIPNAAWPPDPREGSDWSPFGAPGSAAAIAAKPVSSAPVSAAPVSGARASAAGVSTAPAPQDQAPYRVRATARVPVTPPADPSPPGPVANVGFVPPAPVADELALAEPSVTYSEMGELEPQTPDDQALGLEPEALDDPYGPVDPADQPYRSAPPTPAEEPSFARTSESEPLAPEAYEPTGYSAQLDAEPSSEPQAPIESSNWESQASFESSGPDEWSQGEPSASDEWPHGQSWAPAESSRSAPRTSFESSRWEPLAEPASSEPREPSALDGSPSDQRSEARRSEPSVFGESFGEEASAFDSTSFDAQSDADGPEPSALDGSSSAEGSLSAFDRPSYTGRSQVADEPPVEASAGGGRSLDDPRAPERRPHSLDDPWAPESRPRSLDDPWAPESSPVERSLPESQLFAPVEQAIEPSRERALREPSDPVPDEPVVVEPPAPAMRTEDRASGSASLFGADDWASIAVPSEAGPAFGSPQPAAGAPVGDPRSPADADFGGSQPPVDPVVEAIHAFEAERGPSTTGGVQPISGSPAGTSDQALETEREPGVAERYLDLAQPSVDPGRSFRQGLDEADRPWSSAGPDRSFGHGPDVADQAFGGAQPPADADRVLGQEFGEGGPWSSAGPDRSFGHGLDAADQALGGAQPPADADRVLGRELGEGRPWSPADPDRSFGRGVAYESAVAAYGYGQDSVADQAQSPESWEAQPDRPDEPRFDQARAIEHRTSQPDRWPDPPERWEPLGTRSTAAGPIAPERAAIEPDDGASRTTTPPYVARASVTPVADYGRSDDRNVGYARPAEPLPPQARTGSSTAGSYGPALEDRLGTAQEDEVAPRPKAHKPFSERAPAPQWLVPDSPPEPPNEPPHETPPGPTTASEPAPVVARVRASARVPGLIVEAPPVEGAEPMSVPPHAVANASAPPAELGLGGRGPFPLAGEIPAPDLSALVELQIPTGSRPNPGVDEDIAGEGMDRPLPVPHAVEAEPNADGGWPNGPEANAAESPYSSEDWRSNLFGSRAAPVDGAGTVYRGEAEDEADDEDEPLSLTQWILRSVVVAVIIGALVFSFLEGPWISSHF